MDRGSVVKRLQRKRFSDRLLEYVLLTAATIIMVVGIYVFKFPNHFSFGGVTGIAVVLSAVTPLSAGTINFGLNMALLALGFVFLGKESGVKTFYVSMLMSFGLSFMEKVFPMSRPLTDEPMLELVFAIALPAFSSAVLFNIGASSGGTDIVAAIVAKRTNVTIGRTMLFVDFAIISSSFLLTHEIAKVLYGFVVLIITSYMVDLVINTNRQAVQFLIISPNWERIATAVNLHARRGVTVMDGMGWYTKHSVKILLIVCRKIESVTIFRIVKSIDPTAFISQANVNGVYGQGFDELKFKRDLKLQEQLERDSEEAARMS